MAQAEAAYDMEHHVVDNTKRHVSIVSNFMRNGAIVSTHVVVALARSNTITNGKQNVSCFLKHDEKDVGVAKKQWQWPQQQRQLECNEI